MDPTLVAAATALSHTASPSASPTRNPSIFTPTPAPTRQTEAGTLFYAARSNGHSHLYAYTPGDLSPITLTAGPWDDIDPAPSPEQSLIAFSSNRDGPWDLYLLALQTGQIRRLTETAGYDGNPTWSPDGRWIAFEGYHDGDFDIWIVPIDGSQAPIQLTNHPAADIEPSWDPHGRRIAFISSRAGLPDVFLADLDRAEDRLTNLTQTRFLAESSPAFDFDGSSLAFSVHSEGLDFLMVRSMLRPEQDASRVGQGSKAAWIPRDAGLVALLQTPNQSHLVSYALESGDQAPIGFPQLGEVESMAWGTGGLPGSLNTLGLSLPTSEPLYERQSISEVLQASRIRLVDLPGINAPNPSLSDAVDEPFLALREKVAASAGWDFLANLDNAFVGLNDPLPPGFAYNDWLYTGRAFAISEAAVRSGWVEVVREDIGAQTYWRVFVRASKQDGSLGEPLRTHPWDFTARYTGDPSAYDLGGAARKSIPGGFYLDFTQMAADFGFVRVPALPNWRTFYPGARFNEFVLTDGLDWESAMLQLYPASAIQTPTPYRTPTATPTITPSPTPTPWWWRWRTPTPSLAPPLAPTATFSQ